MKAKQQGHFQSEIDYLKRKGVLLQKHIREWTEEIRLDEHPVAVLCSLWVIGLMFAMRHLQRRLI